MINCSSRRSHRRAAVSRRELPTGSNWGRLSGTFTRAKCSAAAIRLADDHGDIQAEIGNMGKRTAWIEGQRCKNRENFFGEKGVQLRALLQAQFVELQQADIRSPASAGNRSSRKKIVGSIDQPIHGRGSSPGVSTGPRPSIPGSCTLFSICCMTPATRTIKNSSMLEPRIDKNLTRSSRGLRRRALLPAPAVETPDGSVRD